MVQGTLDGTPGEYYLLQFFSNASGDPEGGTFLASEDVYLYDNEDGNFTVYIPPGPFDQTAYTVTATDDDGNTSEFSDPQTLKVAASVRASVTLYPLWAQSNT